MKMEMPTEQYWNICYGQPQWLSSSFSTSLANGNEGVGLRMWWDNEIRQDLLENSFGGTSGSVHQQVRTNTMFYSHPHIAFIIFSPYLGSIGSG
jgi:hypothetical protein